MGDNSKKRKRNNSGGDELTSDARVSIQDGLLLLQPMQNSMDVNNLQPFEDGTTNVTVPSSQPAPKKRAKKARKETKDNEDYEDEDFSDGGGFDNWTARKDKKDIKEGLFSPEESQILMNSIDKYIKDHNLGGGDINAGRKIIATQNSRQDGVRGCWMEIASCLPHRTLHAVYGHGIRRIHDGNNKGKWSPEEIEQLRTLVAEHGRKWKVIANIMGRFWSNVRDKWRTEENSVSRTIGPWTREEEQKLIEEVRANQDRVKNADCLLWPKRNIFWERIQKLHNNRSTYQIRSKWSCHVHRFETDAAEDAAAEAAGEPLPDRSKKQKRPTSTPEEDNLIAASICNVVSLNNITSIQDVPFASLGFNLSVYAARRRWLSIVKKHTKHLKNYESLTFLEQVRYVQEQYASVAPDDLPEELTHLIPPPSPEKSKSNKEKKSKESAPISASAETLILNLSGANAWDYTSI